MKSHHAIFVITILVIGSVIIYLVTHNKLTTIVLPNLLSGQVDVETSAHLSSKVTCLINEVKNGTSSNEPMVTPKQILSAADIAKSQKFTGNLLILAGTASDFLNPATKRYDNSTDKESLIMRRNFFGRPGIDHTIKPKDLFRKACPADIGCEFTIDTSRFGEADVVIMQSSGEGTRKTNAWVKRARQEQMFVYYYYEQPHHYTDRMLAFYNQRIGFNWTMHYQRDSTFFWPYGWTKPKPKPIANTMNYAAGKSRKVLWVVSRCDTKAFQHREHFVAAMIPFIDIDVYGKCASSKRDTVDVKRIAKQYKFIISFENADCDDYITEKFFQNLAASNTIPLVLGRRAHYANLAPPLSYIQVDSFSSPRSLAQYLHLLDKNDELYNQYFGWKARFDVQFMPLPVCDLCKKMKEIYYKPSRIDMNNYLSLPKRCWLYPSTQIKDWKSRLVNVTQEEEPWDVIHKYNSKEKPLRFP